MPPENAVPNAPAARAPASGSRVGPLLAWVAVGLALALVAALVRGFRMPLVEVALRGREPELAWIVLDDAAPDALRHALWAGLAAAALLALVGRWSRPAGAALAGAVLLPVATGASSRIAEHPSGLVEEVGAGELAVVGVGLALVALGAAALARRLAPRPVVAGAVGVAAVAVGLALPGRVEARAGEVVGWMELDEVALDLLAEPFEVLRAHPDEAPRAGVLTPSLDYRRDGADMPSLVLPPPAAARIVVRRPGVLRARAGVDRAVLAAAPEGEPAAVRLEARVGGEVVFQGAVPLARDDRGSSWIDVGGAEGIALEAGDELVLATAVVGPGGAEVVPQVAIAAGFGGLQLERRRPWPRRRATPETPNLVLVVMDTQRADRLAAYGYDRPTSPALERLAARGVLYESAHAAASWTWPSTASLLTGLLPQEHGVLDDGSCWLASSLRTLPEALQRAGYTTAGWSSNPLIAPSKNFDQGFERFRASPQAFVKSGAVLEPIVEWIDERGDERFFLYLQLVDPHAPHAPEPEAAELLAPSADGVHPNAINYFKGPLMRREGHTETGERATERVVPPEAQRAISELYDACTWSGDKWLGEVLAALERRGLLDTTVVAYTSDHGEELFDHGLVTHGQTLHQEQVRVPLVLAGPGIPRGVRVTTPVSNVDLPPTLARIAGTRLPAARSFVDLARPAPDGTVPARPVVASTEHGWWNGRYRQPIHALREGDWVLHWAPEGMPWGRMEERPEGMWRLYDLARDPLERNDLADEEPERARAMLARLREALEDAERRRATPSIAAGAGTMELLQDIGYIDGDGG